MGLAGSGPPLPPLSAIRLPASTYLVQSRQENHLPRQKNVSARASEWSVMSPQCERDCEEVLPGLQLSFAITSSTVELRIVLPSTVSIP